jgi:inorganic triphosphatase YgiF
MHTMSMSDTTEIELKLALTKGRLAAAKRALRGVDLRRTEIDDVYFDTPDAGLRRRGMVLRLRRDGDRWMQTLKASAASRSLVPVRGEWEVPIPDGQAPRLPDLARFDAMPLQPLLRSGFDAGALSPVFRTRVARLRGRLVHGTSEIEVSIDRGELQARVEGRRHSRPVAELELELKSGRAADLLDLGASLVGRRRRWALVPALRTKAERGYALAAASGLDVVRASARGFAAQVTPDMPVAGALRAVIRHGLAVLVANADALRDEPDNEHVHQARVALRRMRSAIRLLGSGPDSLPSRFVDGLRWLGRRLGEARDWDVIVDETLPAFVGSADARSGQRRLRNAAQQARKRARARAVAAVRSRRYARLAIGIAQWTMTEPAAPTPSLRDVAPGLLGSAAGKLYKDARTFARLDAGRRHAVRIHAKRLRYALDLFAAALPERGTEDYIEALSVLQDSLGELNDRTVAAERLRSIANDKALRRRIGHWAEHMAPGLVSTASRQLKGLARRPRPWTVEQHA